MDCCSLSTTVPHDKSFTNLCAKNAAVCNLNVNELQVNHINTPTGIAAALGLEPGSNVTFTQGSLVINSASNGLWSVDYTGMANFTSIQPAIDAAAADAAADTPQTVFIYPGVYFENIILRPFVHLTGLNGSAGSLTSPLPLSASVVIRGNAVTELIDTNITNIVQLTNLHLNSIVGPTLYVRGGLVTVVDCVVSTDSGIAVRVDSGTSSPGPVLALQTSQVIAGVSGGTPGQAIVAGNDGGVAGPVVNIAYCTLQPNTASDTVALFGSTIFTAEFTDILGNLTSSVLCSGTIQLRYSNVVGAGKTSVTVGGVATTLILDSCTLNTVVTTVNTLFNAGTARLSNLNVPAGSSVRIGGTGVTTQGTLLINHYVLPRIVIGGSGAFNLTDEQSNVRVFADPFAGVVTVNLPSAVSGTEPPIGWQACVTRAALSIFDIIIDAGVGFTINGRTIQPGPALVTLGGSTATNAGLTGVIGDSIVVTYSSNNIYTIEGVASNWA